MTTRLAPRLRLAAAAVALLSVATACSGDSEEDQSSASSSEGAGTEGVSPPDLPEVPAVRSARGAVADLTLGDCATDAGEQEVEGEVTNSGDQRRDVLVVLSWTNDTSDVLGRGITVVENLPPGESETFTIAAEVADGATQCVPNVQRGIVGRG